MTEIDSPYHDPIISLVQDPNLNKDNDKSSQLIKLIQNITERKVSKLCSSAFIILQTLEKLQMKFKSWEFLSLDYNSDYHFENKDDHIKQFNTGVADKVIVACSEMNIKIVKISADVDYISKSSRTLTPLDLISDSGTMLTSLVLRIIKLKNEITEHLTISYSKAKLISIGQELELMDEDESTVETYKSFIVSLLRQLNEAIESGDFEAKYECLAVINDMEQMFEKFKLERMMTDLSRTIEDNYSSDDEVQEPMSEIPSPPEDHSTDEDFFDYSDSDITNSVYSSQQLPLVHSITRQHTHQAKDSLSSWSQPKPTTITEELPYLMTAFSSAKAFEEDVSHYKSESSSSTTSSQTPISAPSSSRQIPTQETKARSAPPTASAEHRNKPFFHKAANLPDSSLYNESILVEKSLPSPYLNNSLLSRLGIRPQVVTVPMASTQPKGVLIDSKTANKNESNKLPFTKQNLLTQENLHSHDLENDLVD
ncbi:uncharacterized protein SPAPADRAFT_49170 [Spathaspora passalidarum NRRL Y-27907]|uniref:Uncharacterized protein n=1 Tax=Spathaspora passalidarum (strain NRRL Y-27907 / 11-Y1) TaxID=619300 RepID=G3AHD3_SPAPN|nr:uncharacterized protein SPAPADRAFT_49170 [Spathaspora passalidarum NRRL Y-27907]EGW34097.1 hypothetical protein SPAPADRAFT_49170 [Spathaspora passalidarum NRRL Y-27907]